MHYEVKTNVIFPNITGEGGRIVRGNGQGVWFRDTVRHWKEEFSVLPEKTEKTVRACYLCLWRFCDDKNDFIQCFSEKEKCGFCIKQAACWLNCSSQMADAVQTWWIMKKDRTTDRKMAQDAVWAARVVASDPSAVIVLSSNWRIDISEELWRKKRHPERPGDQDLRRNKS